MWESLLWEMISETRFFLFFLNFFFMYIVSKQPKKYLHLIDDNFF